MHEIVAVEELIHNLPNSEGVQGPFVGFKFTYEDGVVYELGPILSVAEYLALGQHIVRQQDIGNNNPDL
ncbi:hypothetical protein SEA_NICEHOUSE_251 [Rhodococcus phage NiceHouse]|nr:hypothetical protein SEA_NICEHOUSE_251 [Rhodococcus phage NiceHouse]